MNAIEVSNLTKVYRLYNSPRDRLREIISLNGKKFHNDFHALNDVSFNIEKGQTVGIIGQNGSGKSTLLKIICGVLQPTSGEVRANGRISALLELGAGFNPEFTGRENVYMNGALMGFSREEMEQRFSDIEAFAEIGEFIDQPVKTYSSGMQVRLAFAAAKWARGKISDGNTILEIICDCSSTAAGDRVTTSAKNIHGNKPATSQIAKLVPPYSGPNLIFKITEKTK